MSRVPRGYWNLKASKREDAAELVDVSLPEVKEFVLSLTDKEKYYYNMQWSTLMLGIVYIRGYRDNDKLVGIAGIYRRYLIAYSSFYMVKETHWNRGVGTKMALDVSQYAKQHGISCVIVQYFPENTQIVRVLEKTGMKCDTRIGEFCYDITPTAKQYVPLKYLLLALIRLRHRLQHVLRGSTFIEIVDTSLVEAKEFINSLTVREKRYHNFEYVVLINFAVYIKGYRLNGKLAGIACILRRYPGIYITPYMVKEGHWNRGLGTHMLAETRDWGKKHHVPFIIYKYISENKAVRRMHEKLGVYNDVRMRSYCYNVIPLQKYALPLRRPILALIWCYNALFER